MKQVKRTDGRCPYCASDNFSQGVLRRPDQRVDECNFCNKHSVLFIRTCIRYPLADPTNTSSPPHI